MSPSPASSTAFPPKEGTQDSIKLVAQSKRHGLLSLRGRGDYTYNGLLCETDLDRKLEAAWPRPEGYVSEIGQVTVIGGGEWVVAWLSEDEMEVTS